MPTTYIKLYICKSHTILSVEFTIFFSLYMSAQGDYLNNLQGDRARKKWYSNLSHYYNIPTSK